MTTQYMLMFSLGPVQPFITQARKTRDLWVGSYLLSKLMEAALRGLDKEKELVFPTDTTVEGNIPDLPNKYVAIFDKQDQAERVAKQSIEQIVDYWSTLCQNVREKILFTGTISQETREIWERQTDPNTLFEIYWVIVAGDTSHYGSWLEQTQQALDARKRLRDFQFQNEYGEKSTISGEREALHGRKTTRQGVKEFWKDLTKNRSLSDISTDGSERLDAIDTIKRFATKATVSGIPQQSFPSTSTVATAPFVKQLLEAQIDASVLKNWEDATRGKLAPMQTDALPFLQTIARESNRNWILKRDGDLYFRETFTAKRLQKDYAIGLEQASEAEARANEGLIALKELLTTTRKLEIPSPTPYYALVQMDGDKMGTLMSGTQSKKDHQEISKALSTFARRAVPSIVEESQQGRLVYAGGDDVLAFTALEGLLTLGDNLQKEYCEQVQKVVPDEERKKNVTASMGIAIAHHYTPLSFVLGAVRDAEKLAKNRYGRNALVVTVIRHSGEQTRVGCRWHYEGLQDDTQPIPLFQHFYDLFDKNTLSPKCVYTLLEDASTLVRLHPDARKSEVKRVLIRQWNRLNGESLDVIERNATSLANKVVKLADKMDEVELEGAREDAEKSTELHEENRRRYGLVEVLGWLLVMVFLTRKGEEE